MSSAAAPDGDHGGDPGGDPDLSERQPLVSDSELAASERQPLVQPGRSQQGGGGEGAAGSRKLTRRELEHGNKPVTNRTPSPGRADVTKASENDVTTDLGRPKCVNGGGGVGGGLGVGDGRALPSCRSPDLPRSMTSDCFENYSNGGKVTFKGLPPDDDAAAGDDSAEWKQRRLSSGDSPHWLPQETSPDMRSITIVVPDPADDSFLIGRASKRGDGTTVPRMTRMTEVAPTNSSIVDGDGDDAWKVPLHDFTSKKQGKNEIRHLKSKRVRSYYKAQDQLISAYEDISLKVNDDLRDTDFVKKQRKLAVNFSKITLAINLMLMIAKLVASVLSGSMSIISSLVDSVVDLLSGLIMWWATRAVRNRDPYAYPQGRTKIEPVSIIILSVVMALASLQLVRESAEKIAQLAGDASSLPSMELPVFIIAGSTVVIKFVLWVVCRKVNSPIVRALAMDHRNDVMSNSVAIVCGYLGSREFQNQFGVHGFIFVDPSGAILISLYIVFNWWQTGSEQIKMLTGHTARPDFLSKLTWTAMNHDREVRHIDTVRAFHFGSNFLVELDIVLPEAMSLRLAHDIGESLQQKLENIPEVERAFVHLDYEYSHNPNSEHKVV